MKFAHDCLEFAQPLGCTEIVQSDLLRKLSVYSVCLRRSLVEFVFGTEKPPFTESAVVASPFPFRLAGGLGSPIGKALSLEIRLKGWGQNRTPGGRQNVSLMESFRVTYRQLYQSPPSGWCCWFRKVGGTERGVVGGSFGWVVLVVGWQALVFRKVGCTE
jgi:hypothetical protein